MNFDEYVVVSNAITSKVVYLKAKRFINTKGGMKLIVRK